MKQCCMMWNFPFVMSGQCLTFLNTGAGGPGFDSQHYVRWLTTTCDSGSRGPYVSGLHRNCTHVHTPLVQTGNTYTYLKTKPQNQSTFASWSISGFGFSHQGYSTAHPRPMRNSILTILWLPPWHLSPCPHLYMNTHVLHAAPQDPHSSPFLPEERNRIQK